MQQSTYECKDCGETFTDAYEAADHGNAEHHVTWNPFADFYQVDE